MRFHILPLELYEYKSHRDIIKIAHSYLDSESLASILTTPRIKLTCGILAIIVSKRIMLGLDFMVARNPDILSLLETLQPLFELRNKLPESCYEAQECLILFDEVRKGIDSFSLQLKDMSIQFGHLHDCYKNINCCQEFVKIAQVVKVDENTIANINSIYEEFIAVHKEITEIMLPSCFIDGKWHQ